MKPCKPKLSLAMLIDARSKLLRAEIKPGISIDDYRAPSFRGALFEYWPGKSDWRWHLKAGNGRIVAQGEGYSSKAAVRRGVAAVIRAAAIAGVIRRSPR